MKGNGLTLKVAGILAVAAIIATFYLDSLNRRLERHQHDLTRTCRDLTARRTGCEAALEDMDKFKKHLDTFLSDKEREIESLKEQITETRRRIGNVEKIRVEFEKLEKELAEVKKVLSLIAGQSEDGR
jgi:predicted  nucleic acid-binding Zn-ribbon protein